MRLCPTCGAEMVQRFRDGKKSGWYCRPCANIRAKAYRVNHPENYLNNKLWTFYRIRLADYQQMVAEQDGRCAVCGVHASEVTLPTESRGFNGNGLVIDHDHACCPSSQGGRTAICGRCIRGLLCQPCNIAIGMARDDPERLEALAGYVRKWEANRG